MIDNFQRSFLEERKEKEENSRKTGRKATPLTWAGNGFPRLSSSRFLYQCVTSYINPILKNHEQQFNIPAGRITKVQELLFSSDT